MASFFGGRYFGKRFYKPGTFFDDEFFGGDFFIDEPATDEQFITFINANRDIYDDDLQYVALAFLHIERVSRWET